MRRLTEEEFKALQNKGILDSEDERDVKDWVAVLYPTANDVKYGRVMYSSSLDLLRYQLFTEFYGNSTVD